MTKWHNAITEKPETGGEYLVCDGFCLEPFIATYHKAFKSWTTHRSRNGSFSQYSSLSDRKVNPKLWIHLQAIPKRT